TPTPPSSSSSPAVKSSWSSPNLFSDVSLQGGGEQGERARGDGSLHRGREGPPVRELLRESDRSGTVAMCRTPPSLLTVW
ncbi:unnamed protein product, partial [Linum tenue]